MEQKPTLLLVDDEERVLRSLKLVFRSLYNVLTTTDPHQAIEMVKQQSVHVIISDQRMPIMQGSDLLREVKLHSPATMRLLLTGYSDLNAIISSINEGEIFRFINKPWDQQELKETVGAAMEIALSTAGVEEVEESDQLMAKPNLVVIDSDPSTHEMVRETIGDKANVLHHTSLEDGLETMSHTDTSLLVTDIRLGDEDISQAINTLRQQNPQLITIVLTSFQDTAKLIDMINHGQVFRFLPKPARRGLLSQCFDSAIKRHESFLRNPQLITRQQAETGKEIDKAGLSERLLGYLQRINKRQELRQG
jgi:DNA-binding NtrC family response regulator